MGATLSHILGASAGKLLSCRQGISRRPAINSACTVLQLLQLVAEQHVCEPYCRRLSVIWLPQNAYRSLPAAFSSLVPISSLQREGTT